MTQKQDFSEVLCMQIPGRYTDFTFVAGMIWSLVQGRHKCLPAGILVKQQGTDSDHRDTLFSSRAGIPIFPRCMSGD